MKEKFYKSKVLEKEQLEELMKTSNHPALLRFILMYSLIILVSCWVVWSWNRSVWEIVASQFFWAVLCCSTFACEHEVAHRTAFKSKSLNIIAGRMLAIFHIYPSSIFRSFHFMHHRYTHVPGKDPEISIGDQPMPSIVASLPMYLSWLSGLPLILFKLFMTISGALGMPEPIRKKVYPFIHPAKRLEVCLESWLVLIFQGTIVFLAITYYNGFWALMIANLVGHCFLASYTAAEHNGLPHEGNIFEKTRSIVAPRFIKILMWNMPYHAEHHAYPAVPFHALPKLSKALGDEVKNKEENHPRFHMAVFSGKYR